jgi:hypothetical protein
VLRVNTDLAPAFAVLSGTGTDWPKLGKNERPEGLQWKGYTLDAKRIPTFHYTWNGVQIDERFDTDGAAMSDSGKIVRTLKLTGPIPAHAAFCAASGSKIEAADGSFIVDGGKFGINNVNYDNHFKVSVEGGIIGNGRLVVPARSEIKVTYTWLTSHLGHAH